MPLRVLVCGGRDFRDAPSLNATLDAIHARDTIGVVIHGDSRGADRLGGEWASSRDIPVLAYPADWKKYGRRAGPIRNEMMLTSARPNLVIATPGGAGTADMVRRSLEAGLRVLPILPRDGIGGASPRSAPSAPKDGGET